ncbi:MAG: thioredoxin domain-containing protein, partial [Lutispora sp.]
SLSGSFDEKYGGMGTAPKFPMPHNIMFLLRYYRITKTEKALQMVIKTLESMYRGGIYDHIGFGFSRYSTDKKWLVPHFEKMLYDNALLMYAYTEAYQATKKALFKDIALQIGEYILRDMTSPMGGFYSAEDADSEGEEGKFYIWDKKEIYDILGEGGGELFCKAYNITDKGNFEGKSIPNLIENESFEKVYKDESLTALRNKLYEYRERREHPFKDDKILTSWNGLMIAAMAFSGRVFDNIEFLDAAKKAVDFILMNLRRQDGRLLARYREGSADHLGYLDDYAFFIWGLIELYQAGFDERYISTAAELADDMLKLFYDKEQKGFFIYGIDGEKLITRPKELYDGAMPSGNSVAALTLLKLSRLTDKNEYEDIVNDMFQSFGGKVGRYPAGYTYFLSAYMLAAKESMEVVLVGKREAKETSEMLRIVNDEFLPHIAISLKKNGDNNYTMLDDKTTAYICRGYSCSKPIKDIDEFSKAILLG